MQPKVRAWVAFNDVTKFGKGRAELLRLLDAEGSLKRAVERLGMSYRAAWGYIHELEAAAGFAVVERVGKGPSGGTRLTPDGRAFVASYEAFRAAVEAAADRAYRASFPTHAPSRPTQPGRAARRAAAPARATRRRS